MQAEILMERLDKEKQEEISQMKIRFYVNISHELRTPLTLIVAPLQELLSRISGHWEHEQLLYIQRNTNRLLHLVNQLMDYRRAELGIFELRLVSANAYKRVLNSFMNYESLSKKKDIDYNFYTELQDKELLFDENYLDLIVNNLLSNAFKYTEEGESITVKLYQEAGDLVLQVTDTGIGIPKEKQEKILRGSIKWKADVKEAVLVFPWYNGWLNCTMEELSWRVNPEKVLLSPFTFRKINLYIAVKNCLEEKRTQTINGYTLRMRTTYISVMKKKPIQKAKKMRIQINEEHSLWWKTIKN